MALDKVYVVWKWDYEDSDILKICSSRKVAEAYKDDLTTRKRDGDGNGPAYPRHRATDLEIQEHELFYQGPLAQNSR